MPVPPENSKHHEQTQPEEGLTLSGVFTQVYEELKRQNPHREVNLENPVFVSVSDDSDWHRKRVGRMVYDSAIIITVGGKNWLVAKATQTDGYPADMFSDDLTAIPYDPADKSEEEINNEAQQLIGDSTYFKNSLVFALYNGRLGFNSKGRFDTKVHSSLESPPNEFITQEMVVHNSWVYPDLRPVVTSPVNYKPEFIPALTEAISKTLSWAGKDEVKLEV